MKCFHCDQEIIEPDMSDLSAALWTSCNACRTLYMWSSRSILSQYIIRCTHNNKSYLMLFNIHSSPLFILCAIDQHYNSICLLTFDYLPKITPKNINDKLST